MLQVRFAQSCHEKLHVNTTRLPLRLEFLFLVNLISVYVKATLIDFNLFFVVQTHATNYG